MSDLTAGTTAGVQSQALTMARFLLLAVDEALQAKIAQTPAGTASLRETEILTWRTLSGNAIALANQFLAATPGLPPLPVALVSSAVAQVNSALRILAAIPVASPLIFPPRPGGASVPLVVLLQVQNLVQLAVQALEDAERRIASA